MRLLVDENVEQTRATQLTALGHDVSAIGRDRTGSLKDREVLAVAAKEQRVLITNDQDFGELVFRRRLPHAGVILVRLPEATIALKLAGVLSALAEMERENRLFLVVEPGAMRVRRSQL